MLEPGWALDARVSLAVFGIEFSTSTYDLCCPHCGVFADHGYSKDCYYSSNDNAAKAVVWAMWEKGYRVVLSGDADHSRVGFYGEHSAVCSSSFAHAVCIAALEALEVEG